METLSRLDYLLDLPWVAPLAWTLVHFLWQGALIGLVAAFVLRAAQGSSPQVRYALGLTALAACALVPVVTFLVLAKPFVTAAPRIVALGNAPAPVSTPVATAVPSASPEPVSSSAPVASIPAPAAAPAIEPVAKPFALPSIADLVRWLVPAWLGGVCLLALRLGLAWLRVQGWRAKSTAPADPWLTQATERLAGLLEVKGTVPVRLSTLVPGPLTLGTLRPVILLPAQLLTGLSRDHIEAILAHELAHIRRHDYVVNLLQSALEVILFFHPVVWWLNRHVRQSREECCDAVAAASCGDRAAYLRALASLAEFQAAPALGARDGELLARVLRLLGRHPSDPVFTGRNAAWFLCLFVAVLAAVGIIFSARLLAAGDPPMANTKRAPRGIVSDENGSPIAGAEVLLYYQKSYYGLDNRVVARERTDSAGRFAFSDSLPFETPRGSDRTDHYVLFAMAEGRAPGWQVILGGTPGQDSYPLTVTKPLSQSYEVVDKAGQPVAGARVWLRAALAQQDKPPFFPEGFLVPADLGLASAVTDARGRATLTSLPDTNYSVAASKEGFEDELSCTTPRDGVPRFTLKPGAVLEGRVTDPLGLPVEGAVVWLYPKFRFHTYFLAKTDAQGRYRIEKIWSNGDSADWGKYEVGIRHPNFAAKRDVVAFASGQHITGHDIAAVPGVKINGALLDAATGAPIAGGGVIVDSESGRRTLFSDNAGHFECRVFPGRMSAFGSEPPGGFYFVEDSFGMRQRVDATAAGAEMDVSVTLGGRLGPLGDITGTVTDASGAPAASVRVRAQPLRLTYRPTPLNHRTDRGTYTDASGRFTLTNLPVGLACMVFAQGPDGKSFALQKTDMAQDPQILSAPLRLLPTSELSLTVLDGGRRPLADATVQFTPIADNVDLFALQQDVKSDSAGILKISNVLPGMVYEMEIKGKSSTRTQAILSGSDGRPTSESLVLSDRWTVRLEDSTGQPVAIKGFKEYSVLRTYEGRPTRWSNGPLDILARQGTDVVVSRDILYGNPGEEINALIEAESGQILETTGKIPSLAGAPIVLTTKADITRLDTEPDATIPNVAATEFAGRILDPQGNPVPDAEITLAGSEWLGNRTPFKTDAQGIFRIPDREGKWYTYLSVTKEGYAPVFVTDIPLGHGFSVRLQDTTRLRGIIGGENPGKVDILLEKDKPTKRERMGFSVRGLQQRATTDAAGRYDFAVEPGVYKYQLANDDGRFARGEIVVSPDAVAAFPQPLQKGHAVTFQIIDWQTGSPVPGLPVTISERLDVGMIGEKPGSKRASDKNGEIRWDNLTPGETEFWSNALFIAGAQDKQVPYARWWREDEPAEWRRINAKAKPPVTRDGTQPLVIDVVPDMKPIRILAERAVRVSGVVTTPSGQPVPDLQVGVVPNEGRSATLTGDSKFTFSTDDHGRFDGYIPAGNGVIYNLCAYTWPEGTPNSNTVANAVSESFSSKPGDEFTFKLTAVKGGWIKGRVVDSSGAPLAGLEVQTSNTDWRDSSYADRTATTGPDGSFRVGPLRSGSYLVRPDTSKRVNIATEPGFTPPTVTIMDDNEVTIPDIGFPLPPQQGKR